MTAESQVPRMFAAAALPYEELVARLMDAATAPAAKPPCRRIAESVMPGRSRVPAAQVAVHDPLEVWKTWPTDLRDGQVQAGHFLPEEAPGETPRHLVALLG